MFFLYNIIAHSIRLFIRFCGLFSSRKKELFTHRTVYKKQNSSQPTLWFHASSYGEFEGILPIIKEAHQERNHFILCSFFSPSGFTALHGHPLVDQVVYSPMDTKKDVSHFLRVFAPTTLIVSQNDFWPQMIKSCLNSQIPVYFVGTYVRQNHWWLQRLGSPINSILKDVTRLYVQDNDSFELLTKAGFTNIDMSGNPRVDQVISNASEKKSYPILEAFAQRKPLLVCGSTLAKDESYILAAVDQDDGVNVLLIPHDPATFDYNQLSRFSWIKYSQIEHVCPPNIQILVMDTLGDLKYVYQYGRIAYVGGGFDAGVHSVLEPAVFNVPILSGPNIKKFKSAVDLEKLNCLTIIQNTHELQSAVKTLINRENRDTAARLESYINSSKGASTQIWNSIRL